MKRGYGVVICLSLVIILSLSLVSAGFFGDFWNKITGKAVEGECTDSDNGTSLYTKGTVTLPNGLSYTDFCRNNSFVTEITCSVGGGWTVKDYSCPNGCSNGICLSASSGGGSSGGGGGGTNTTRICNDSDGGINANIFGITIFSNWTGKDFCYIPINNSWTEVPSCVGQTCHVYESYCDFNSVNNIGRTKIYCPNGCSDGACKLECNLNQIIGDINGDGKIDLSDVTLTMKISLGTISKPSDLCCIDLNKDGKVDVSDVILVNRIALKLDNSSGKCEEKIIPECSSNLDCASTGTAYCENSSLCSKTSVQSCINSKCILNTTIVKCLDCDYGCENLACLPGECDSLIEKVKNPIDFSEYDVDYKLNWNGSYESEWWIDGKNEPLTEYYASWHTYYGEKNYYVSYSVDVFDNKNINLESWLKDRTNYEICKATSYWSTDNKENKVYVCNWNVLNNNQDLNQYKSKSRQILWIKNNILVAIDTNVGGYLSDEEFSKIAQKRLNNFLDDLKNNELNYVDWENFNIDWPLSYLIEKELSECPSGIDLGTCSACWLCKTEPVVCPPHGEQKNICIDSCCNNENIEQTIYCSPGECAGCYTPRWGGGYSGEDNKCIPYGFRFEQTTDNFIETKIEREEHDILYEDDFVNDKEISLDIISDNEAILTFYWENDSYFYTLVPGVEIIIDIPWAEEDIDYLLFTNDIFHSDVYSNESKSYVDLTIRYTYMGQTYETLNAYCDIDGKIHTQKTVDYQGNWASCQNNYECESNLCSSGECIEVTKMIEEASGFKSLFARVLCRLAHLFNEDNYDTCVINFLGG